MLSKTHVTTGVAISVLATQPSTIPGLMCAIIGGAIGGDICDIDHNRKTLPIIDDEEDNEGSQSGLFLCLMLIVLTIAIEFIGTNTFIEYCTEHFSLYSIPLLLLFFLICVIGSRTSHRGFMHSIISMLFLASLLYIAFPPILLPFFLGYLSHIILDLTNKRGIQLFFPFKKRLCTGWFPAGGRANNIIAVLSTIIALSSIIMIFFNSIIIKSNDLNLVDLRNYLINSGYINAFTIYMIIVNIIAFLLYSRDYILYYSLDKNDEYWDSSELQILHGIMEATSIFGGIFGQLSVFIFYRIKPQKENAFWLTKIICLTLIWIVLLLIIYNPLELSLLDEIDLTPRNHLPLILYLSIINIVSFIIFLKDTNKRTKWTRSEFWLYLLGLSGGSIGALVAIAITGNNENSAHFSHGFFYFLIAQVFIVAYLIHAGLA